VDWTGPLGDAVAIRLIGFYEKGESFRDRLESERYGALPSVLLRLSETTSLS
jgi:iron complex outermembrane receptor protein